MESESAQSTSISLSSAPSSASFSTSPLPSSSSSPSPPPPPVLLSSFHQFSIVMEYIPHGDLFSWLNSSEKIFFSQKIQAAKNIAEALEFLHGKSIVHHDVKSLNVLISSKDKDAKNVAKLADFGEARMFYAWSTRDNVHNPSMEADGRRDGTRK